MTPTPQQFAALANASRAMLAYAWTRTPRSDILITNGLIAVGKTFSADPKASAALLRRAIEPEHLKEHGYKDLRWLSRQIRTIAKDDSAFAADIYQAAFGYSEPSDDATPMGNSALLAMRSNKRQDYQSSWYALTEPLPEILRNNLETGVRALVAGLDAYVKRERNNDPYPGEPREGEFALGAATAHFCVDWSHSWYRAGYKPLTDAPVLLTKFEAVLFAFAGQDDAAATMERILRILATQHSVPASIWASLLIAGEQHPALYANQLFPLALADPLIRSSDTRYQLGSFIKAAYEYLPAASRVAFEQNLLALSGERAERYRTVLAGCIPLQLVATEAMHAFLAKIERSGAARANTPPVQFTSSSRPFDADAYLESEGVSLKEADNTALREEIAQMEELVPLGSLDLSLKTVRQQIAILSAIGSRLDNVYAGKVPATLHDLAYGMLAEGASRLARAVPAVLADAKVRLPLKRLLLRCATSQNPHYNAAHEKTFHENLSWGGPSARAAAAEGLMNFTRVGKTRDPQLMAAIRILARDKVPEVRMQIVGNLAMLGNLDKVLAWSEIEHALKTDPTRGIVSCALSALARLSFQDLPRTIRDAKSVLLRYRNKSGPGMAACRETASQLIIDLHIFGVQPEATKFAAEMTAKVVRNASAMRALVARYSDTLLQGNVIDAGAADNEPRKKTLAFYSELTERAFAEINGRTRRLDIDKFGTWPVADQDAVREMFGILDEIALRLQFAAGAHHDGGLPDDTVSPAQVRLYWEAKPIMVRLANAIVAPVAHCLIQGLERFIPVDPHGVFSLIAQAVKSAERGGYSNESMAADLIVRIVKRYLADYRAIFADRARLEELMDCLDAFVRAGWPAAQSLTFQLGEIWR